LAMELLPHHERFAGGFTKTGRNSRKIF